MISRNQLVRRTKVIILAIFSLLFLWHGALHAQFTTASLNGTVVDASGGIVPDAKVTVRNLDTGFKQTVETDSTGTFLFPRLPVGNYRLTVEKSGFSTYLQDGITLAVNQAASQAVSLRVGEVTETVTVAAEADLVTTATSTVGQLIDQQRVVDLPLNGRTAQSLVFLSAGTVDTTDRYCGFGCHGGVYPGEQQATVNGGGPGAVNYQLDGVSHNDSYLNINLPFPNPDAVQEFSLQSNNMSAEYGNAVGGVVNIVSKSGTNEIHGDLFEFLRNGALNARNYFAPRHDTLNRNQFGGSIGGPIAKDKLFYFGTYQGTRIRSAAEGRIAFVPTEAERRGDFSGVQTQLIDPVTGSPFLNNQIPVNRFSPVSQFLLQNWIPLPNGQDRELTFTGPKFVQDEDQWMTKIDYTQGKHQLTGRYFFTDYRQPASVPQGNILAATDQANAVRVQNLAVNHNYTVSPKLLFNTWFGWDTQKGGSLSSAPFGPTDAGINIAVPQAPPELIVIVSGAFNIGTGHRGVFDRGGWTLRENVTWIRGSHELHFGGEAEHVWNEIGNTFRMFGQSFFTNSLSGDNLVDFMLGRLSRFNQASGNFKLLRGTKWSGFLQDNWRVNQRLTLNLGLRWDPFFAFKEDNGRLACFVPGAKSSRYVNAPVGLIYGGDDHDPGCPVGITENNLGNLAPRVGFAYRLTQDGKTSLRGGAGYYYIRPDTSIFNNTLYPPFRPAFNVFDVDFQDPYGSAGVPNPFPANFFDQKLPPPDVPFTTPALIVSINQRDFHIPLLTGWNLTLERQIGGSWLVRAAYVGNKGTFLYGSNQKNTIDVNPAIYIPGASTIGNTQERRVYKDFDSIIVTTSDINSNYHGLQLSLQKRFSRGLSLLANYTWSKTVDDYNHSNPFNRHFDYGRSDDDISHTLNVSGIWQLPKMNVSGLANGLLNGWALTSIMVWRAGFPFSIYSGLDNSFSGVGLDRADFVGSDIHAAQLDSGRPHGQLISEFFDTSLFVPNAIGTFGNTGKNILRGPRFFNTDFGMLKNTRITERAALQFRAEFFNLFNNVNFNQPDNYVSDGPGVFGGIFSAKDPRILQFALKLLF
ncbi:MAG: hypothetical protein DMG05_03310 [Acidobacteria bacterium]|nr:MAG: hypothetical protein DMG05_03310 [Acidobacteriota bacterium]